MTSTHLIYATKTELVKVSHTGQQAWRKPLKLMTFELSANGTRLIGVLDAPGRSEVVNIDLATGNTLGSKILGSAFWNLSVSPNGKYAAATTKDRLYLFDAGVLTRDLALPVRWAVSLDV